MCGIVGSASLLKPIDQDWIKNACNLIEHRGPDGNGNFFSNNNKVGFGHTRLSIFDTSHNGSQPMLDIESKMAIIFNGEIYNFLELKTELISLGYSFSSRSDTEVLLSSYKEWGKDCLKKIRGMYAFSIYDEKKNIIFIARDRAGEKPLFYSHQQSSLFFASELKALMLNQSLPRKINSCALDCYLSIGYIPGDLCILEGYNKLPAGHAMTYDISANKIDVFKYWDLPDYKDNDLYKSNDDYINKLDNLLDESVALQMEADVPVGVLLSGGLDSSLITAMASRHSSRVKTFNISFPGHSSYDESKYASEIAQHFNTDHIMLEANPTSSDFVTKLATQVDEPMADSSIIPTYMVSKLVKEHCTVALGGDGGDELFGGYSHYSRLAWVNKNFRFVPFKIKQKISSIAEKKLPIGFKGRNWLMSMAVDYSKGLPIIASFFDPSSRQKLIPEYSNFYNMAEEIIEKKIPKDSDLIQRATRMDFKNYLAEDILVKVDRASMINSLEIRAPFLDNKLIEFAYADVPSELKANASDKKILLKMLAARLLPDNFDINRKQGFSIPLSEWLKSGSFRELFHDVLLDSGCIFNKKAVNNLLQGQDKGYSNGERLFSLVMFELWRRKYDCHL